MDQTTLWCVEQEFKALPQYMRCKVVRKRTQYPHGAQELEIALWNATVDRKIELIKDSGLELSLREMEGRKALWGRAKEENDFKMVMVPGFQYRLIEFHAQQMVLDIERVIYSEIEALKSHDYKELFEKAGLPLPHGPIAPALYAATIDGYVIGTVRGIATNKNPGGIWVIGGDIDEPNLTIGDHIFKREAQEELQGTGSLSHHYIALGIIFDRVLHKHDIVVLASYTTPFNRFKKGDKFLPDVASITRISLREEELERYIVDNYLDSLDPSDKRWVGRPVSACNSGLYVVGKHLYGEEWAERVLQQLPKQKE